MARPTTTWPGGAYTASGVAHGELQLSLVHAYGRANIIEGQGSSDWDVTPLARTWAGFWGGGIVNPGDNTGVVLALKDEPCAPDPLRCGGFMFAAPSVWQNDELE